MSKVCLFIISYDKYRLSQEALRGRFSSTSSTRDSRVAIQSEIEVVKYLKCKITLSSVKY